MEKRTMNDYTVEHDGILKRGEGYYERGQILRIC